MKIPIGEMREPAVVLRPIVSTDSSAGQVTNYDPEKPIFIALRPVSTTERSTFRQVDGEISHQIFGHYQELHHVKSDWRIRVIESGEEFDIKGPPMNMPNKDVTRLNVVSRENG